MFSTKNSVRLAAVLGGAMIAAGLSGAAHAATIVVRANGPSAPSYPPGTKLPDNGTIVLKSGDTVTVLDARGTRVLRGPGAVAVAGSNTASVNGIAALIADNGLRQTRTGATRGQTTPPHPTNVWMVDATRGGPVCVINPAALALWRPTSDADATLTLNTGSASSSVAFRTGQAVRAWPGDTIPVATGTRVTLTGLGASPVSIEFHVLRTVPTTLDDTAQVLLSQGCVAQLDVLVDSTTPEPAQ